MNKLKLLNRPAILQIYLPLIIGGFIYLGFRSTSLLMFKYFKFLGMQQAIEKLRVFVNPLSDGLPEWVIFSLPDGLWTFAFVAYILQVNGGRPSNWLALPVIFSIGVELAQMTQYVPGTFDYIDLIISILALALSYNLNKKKYK